ncbi:MAG: hypothetical protein PVF85_10045 [Anaerolineales bacterium]|jgi:hypothetical protein
MNTIRNRKHLNSLLAVSVLAVLMVSAFVSVGTASADDGVQPEPRHPGDRIDERLEALLEKLNEWYAIQDENLGKADNAIDRIEGVLAKAGELGIDTSEIQALMPGLYAAVGRAENAHSTAGEILDEHAGFNGGGKVKDRQQAIETLRSAREALRTAKDSLVEARGIVKDIIDLLKDLRRNYTPEVETLG